MSAPRGDTLNEQINKEKISCRYSLFDDAVEMVAGAGRYVYMAKLDLKNAFRLCPVRKEDWWLLGFKWDKKFYVYTSLPFGSRSSPAIFNQFAGLLCWLYVQIGEIPTVTHYLDDYFLWPAPRFLARQI